MIQFLIVDLFCGAGGTTTGFEQADNGIAKVIAAVNHDPIAIKSHWHNHPHIRHWEEDIRKVNVHELAAYVLTWQRKYPKAKLILWASLECTNFSKAKGGMSREADSRTLATHLYRYIDALDPDYLMIENVVEFKAWGPLRIKCKKVVKRNDKHGGPRCDLAFDKKTNLPIWIPVVHLKGTHWNAWRNTVKNCGYVDDWKELNSANFGAYTSRNRLFGMFGRPWLPITWPESTHAKNPVKGDLFANHLAKWKPVKEVLDFSDKGQSIFDREKKKNKVRRRKGAPVKQLAKKKKKKQDGLCEKTLERIYAGLIKFVAGGKKEFMIKYNSTNQKTGISHPVDVENPSPVVSPQGRLSVVQPEFITQYHGGKASFQKSRNLSVENPLRVIPTENRFGLVQSEFISKNYSGDPHSKNISVDGPAGSITTKDSQSLISPEFIVQRNGGNPESKLVDVNNPARTLNQTGGNQELVQPEFLVNYNHSSEADSLDKPSPTLVTRDKLSLAQPEFLMRYYGANAEFRNHSVEHPAGALRKNNSHVLVQPEFITTYHGNGDNIHSVNSPSPVLPTKDSVAVVQAEHFIHRNIGDHENVQSIDKPAGSLMGEPKMDLVFIQKYHSGGGQLESVENPSGAVLPIDKSRLVTAEPFILDGNFNNPPSSIEQPSKTLLASRRHHYIINPIRDSKGSSVDAPLGVITATRRHRHYLCNLQWHGATSSVDQPCPVIIARQDKQPLYFITTVHSEIPFAIAVYKKDSAATIKIKEFMALYGIVDIKMRMLNIPELKKIQGFPSDYVLMGTQADQKKFIGNSVVPVICKKMAEALGTRLRELKNKAA